MARNISNRSFPQKVASTAVWMVVLPAVVVVQLVRGKKKPYTVTRLASKIRKF